MSPFFKPHQYKYVKLLELMDIKVIIKNGLKIPKDFIENIVVFRNFFFIFIHFVFQSYRILFFCVMSNP